MIFYATNNCRDTIEIWYGSEPPENCSNCCIFEPTPDCELLCAFGNDEFESMYGWQPEPGEFRILKPFDLQPLEEK